MTDTTEREALDQLWLDVKGNTYAADAKQQAELARFTALLDAEAYLSAAEIAQRDGVDTNWLAFRGAVRFTLAEYHDLTNEARAALEPDND